MKIEFSDQTYEAIVAIAPDVSEFVEQAARERLEKRTLAPSVTGLVTRFSEFRGIMKGVTKAEIVEARHQDRR